KKEKHRSHSRTQTRFWSVVLGSPPPRTPHAPLLQFNPRSPYDNNNKEQRRHGTIKAPHRCRARRRYWARNMAAAIKIFDAVKVPFHYNYIDMGKDIYLKGYSNGMTPEAKDTVERLGILFKGPMETPKGVGVKSINVTARKVWSTFANKRVFKTLPGVETVYSRAGINVDLTLFRENIEDTYGGIEHYQTNDVAQTRRLITRPGSLQIHRMAFEYGLGEKADAIQRGLEAALASGDRTRDLVQLPGRSPLGTDGFADSVIHHIAPEAKATSVAFSDIKFTAPVKPAANPMLSDTAARDRTKEKTVGTDFFVDSELLPNQVADVIQGVLSKEKDAAPFALTMISNRGTQVWPTGSLFTEVVNHYRCRLELKNKEEGGAKESDLLELVSDISKKIRVCSLEMLLEIDGKKGYSLAQGQ
ncbi:hypothetical protein DFJ73DRAFT_896834, partial [Zopfochytrium polystomum]